VIHLDTGYLIGLLVKGSRQTSLVDGWLAVCALVAAFEVAPGTRIHKEPRKQGSQEIASPGAKAFPHDLLASLLPGFLRDRQRKGATPLVGLRHGLAKANYYYFRQPAVLVRKMLLRIHT